MSSAWQSKDLKCGRLMMFAELLSFFVDFIVMINVGIGKLKSLEFCVH